MMSAVEAHPRPARPSAPPTAMAMVKDKRGKALNKASGGFSVDLESVDFENRDGVEQRRRSMTLGSRPPPRSRQAQEKPPACVPHVIDSSGRSPKAAHKAAEKSSGPPPPRPNRPPPPRTQTQPQLSLSTSNPANSLQNAQGEEPRYEDMSFLTKKKEEPRYEGVPVLPKGAEPRYEGVPILPKGTEPSVPVSLKANEPRYEGVPVLPQGGDTIPVRRTLSHEEEPRYEGVAVLRRRLSSEGSNSMKRPSVAARKRLSSPSSREVSPLPQLPEGETAKNLSRPPSTSSPTKPTPPTRTTSPPGPNPPHPPVTAKRSRSLSSPPRASPPPRATPPLKVTIPTHKVTTPTHKVTTPPPQAPSIVMPPPQTSPVVTTPPPQVAMPPPPVTTPPISPTRKDASPTSPQSETPAEDKATEPNTNPAVPPRPFMPPRPFPPRAGTASHMKRVHKKPHPPGSRPTSAPPKATNSTDPPIPARPKKSPSNSARKSPRRVPKQVLNHQKPPSKSASAREKPSGSTSPSRMRESPQSSTVNEPSVDERTTVTTPDPVFSPTPRSPVPPEPEVVLSPVPVPVSPSPVQSREQTSPQLLSPSSANGGSQEEREEAREVGVGGVGTSPGVGQQDLSRQQSSDHEEEEEDTVDPLPPLGSSLNSSQGKGRKMFASMKKSFRSLRIARPKSSSPSTRKRGHSDADVMHGKRLYPDPLPQGIIHPLVVQCVAYLNRESVLEEEGLFRVPGDLAVIRRLREDFMQGYYVDLMEVLDPHTVAGLLKLHFREQKSSLIPRGQPLIEFMANVKSQDVEAVRAQFDQLEVISVATLSIVIEVLCKIAAHSSKNMMTSGIIATSCGPSLFPYLPPSNANQTTKFLIDHCDTVFKSPHTTPNN